MKYLLFNWEDVDCNDPSELTNEEFEEERNEQT